MAGDLRSCGFIFEANQHHFQSCLTYLYSNRPTDNCAIASCIAGSTSCIAVTFSWIPESSSWTVVTFPAMFGSISWISVISFVIPGSAPMIVVTLRLVSRIPGSSLETSSAYVLTVTRLRFTACNSVLHQFLVIHKIIKVGRRQTHESMVAMQSAKELFSCTSFPKCLRIFFSFLIPSTVFHNLLALPSSAAANTFHSISSSWSASV